MLPLVSSVLTDLVHKIPEFLSLPTGSKLVTPQSFSFLARSLPIGYFHFYYFSFFLTSNRMGAWSRCVATCLYTLYVAANESTSGWEFNCLFLNPHRVLLTLFYPLFIHLAFLLCSLRSHILFQNCFIY